MTGDEQFKEFISTHKPRFRDENGYPDYQTSDLQAAWLDSRHETVEDITQFIADLSVFGSCELQEQQAIRFKERIIAAIRARFPGGAS